MATSLPSSSPSAVNAPLLAGPIGSKMTNGSGSKISLKDLEVQSMASNGQETSPNGATSSTSTPPTTTSSTVAPPAAPVSSSSTATASSSSVVVPPPLQSTSTPPSLLPPPPPPRPVFSVSSSGTVCVFYSLKDNPNAIISYSELVKQEQKRMRDSSIQAAAAATAATATKKSKAEKTGVKSNNNNQNTNGGANSGSGNGAVASTSTDMDIDKPTPLSTNATSTTGTAAAGSEAEDDDEEDDEEAEEDDEEGEGGEDDEDDDDEEEERGVAGEDEESDGFKRPPRDFLEVLTEKYGAMDENGNEGEDEEEDEDSEVPHKPAKRPSRWDTEHYDMEDEFIDDSEMMLDDIGLVRTKVDGFFAFRGPVETTTEEADSSDAVGGSSRSKRTTKKKTTGTSSPLAQVRAQATKAKGSNLAVVETANDSVSDWSEMEDKPKTGGSPLAGDTVMATAAGAEAETPAQSGAVTDSGSTTKKKAASTKGKGSTSNTKDAVPKATTTKETVAKSAAAKKDDAKDSDKDQKGPSTKVKRTKPKATDTTADGSTPATATTSTATATTAQSTSPTKTKAKAPSTSKTLAELRELLAANAAAAASGSGSTATTSITGTPATTSIATNPVTVGSSSSTSTQQHRPATVAPSDGSGPKVKQVYPLTPQVQVAFERVKVLAVQETWEVKHRFPPHIKAPLFDCARVALQVRNSGYVLDDNFFFHLQEILPYNKFTLKKLIYKNVLPGWLEELEGQRIRCMSMFKERAKAAWLNSGLAESENNKSRPEQDADGDVPMDGGEESKKGRFPWTQDLRLILWETMEKIMEILTVKMELHGVDDQYPAPVSESKTRKDSYQMLLRFFPKDWMTSYEISRQYSALKEKIQKQERREVQEVEHPPGRAMTKATVPKVTTPSTSTTSSPLPKPPSSSGGSSSHTSSLPMPHSPTKQPYSSPSNPIVILDNSPTGSDIKKRKPEDSAAVAPTHTTVYDAQGVPRAVSRVPPFPLSSSGSTVASGSSTNGSPSVGYMSQGSNSGYGHHVEQDSMNGQKKKRAKIPPPTQPLSGLGPMDMPIVGVVRSGSGVVPSNRGVTSSPSSSTSSGYYPGPSSGRMGIEHSSAPPPTHPQGSNYNKHPPPTHSQQGHHHIHGNSHSRPPMPPRPPSNDGGKGPTSGNGGQQSSTSRSPMSLTNMIN